MATALPDRTAPRCTSCDLGHSEVGDSFLQEQRRTPLDLPVPKRLSLFFGSLPVDTVCLTNNGSSRCPRTNFDTDLQILGEGSMVSQPQKCASRTAFCACPPSRMPLPAPRQIGSLAGTLADHAQKGGPASWLVCSQVPFGYPLRTL
jgi:hypothetical protein